MGGLSETPFVTFHDGWSGLVWSCTCRVTGAGDAEAVRASGREHAARHAAEAVAAALAEAADAIEGRVARNIGGHPFADRDRGLREAARVIRGMAPPP